MMTPDRMMPAFFSSSEALSTYCVQPPWPRLCSSTFQASQHLNNPQAAGSSNSQRAFASWTLSRAVWATRSPGSQYQGEKHLLN